MNNIKNVAIITGASSGLGAEYAKLLDKEGLDELWLIARRKERLDSLAAKLRTQCQILTLDLTDEMRLDELERELAGQKPHVTYLVNAAGFGCIGTCQRGAVFWKLYHAQRSNQYLILLSMRPARPLCCHIAEH